MAKLLDPAGFKGGNKSLSLNGKVFPVGPQISLASGLKPFSALGFPVNGTAAIVNKAGAIIDGFDLRNHDILVQADNVTLRNCLLNATAYHTVQCMMNRGFVCEFNMFDGEKADRQHSDFVYSEVGDIIYRNNIAIESPTDQINIVGGLVEHNAFVSAAFATGAHADAISVHKTFAPVVIRENYIDFTNRPGQKTGTNAAVKVVSHFGLINDVLVEANVLLGGGFNSYVGDGAKGLPNNVRFLKNLMGLTEYGDKETQFLYPGDHGTAFVFSGSTLFSAAPDDVVAFASGVPAPAPAPAPVPAPVPGRAFTDAQLTAMRQNVAALTEMLK